MPRNKAAALWIPFAVLLHASPPSCVSCHPAEARTQPRTPMGIGIELPPDQETLKAHPQLEFEKNGFTYSIERQDGASTYTVRDGGGSLTLPIKYAFGVGMQTFVLEREGRFYESLVSYYPRIAGLAITMGSERLRPANLVEAMGRQTSSDEITACFNCHATDAVRDGRLALDSLRPGLDCGHCHAGADAHMRALAAGKPGPIPPRLARRTAEDTSSFCGQCHRTWDSVVRMRLWGPLNVRFQPYRLANSKCFLGNDRRIACTACHNPHQDLVREDSSYDAKCLACHSTAAAANTSWKTCPISKTNCVSCHMPKVELPGGHSTFTDHTIRVAHVGAPYPD